VKKASAPKLIDVAALANVSTATVSRFFNNPELLAEETAEKIRRVVEETGYIPNLVAGGLASKRSRLVSLLIPYISHSLFNPMIEAMLSEFSDAGIVVMLGVTQADARQEERLIYAALSRQADAIIASGELSPRLADAVRQSGTAVIEIWDLAEQPIDYAVGFSHNAVGAETARFVRKRGYLQPHLIIGDGTRARKRRDGFVEEWRRTSQVVPTESSVEVPSNFGHARSSFAHIRRLKQMPDVVVCGSDTLAQGMIVEARFAGLRVPDDLAVIGFGNHTLASEMRPTITSIDIDGAQIAREVVSILQMREKGVEVEPRSIDVGFRLIARESA
jgi:LacI family gluconate utilization system Gnt-I transcriptional repressor